jgi:hypothetical protein
MDRELYARSTIDVPVTTADTPVAVGVQARVDMHMSIVLGAAQLAMVTTVADMLGGHGGTARYARSARCLCTSLLKLGADVTVAARHRTSQQHRVRYG